MFTLIKVEQTKHDREILSKLNSVNLSKIKPVNCKSANTAFLKFMQKLLMNTKCSPVYLRLTIENCNNKIETKTVGRKKLRTAINSFQFIHFIVT